MAKSSSYPNGFLNGLTVRGVPVLNSHAGNVFWVDSGIGSNGNSGASKDRPFATWDYAVGRCTANNGDIIILAPGHAETITAANTLTLDVAGVSVVGLGTGASRPTITVSTDAAATVTISAASCSIENVVFKAALDGLNTTVTVSGAGCYLDIEHQDTSASVEADIAIACTGDQFTCKLRDIGFATGDQRDQSITLNGVDNARIDIDFYGKVGTAVVNMITAACTDVEVRGTMYVSGTTDGSKDVVDTITGSTWYMEVDDAAAGARYSGGSASAVASDDVTAVNTSLTTIKNVLYDTTGIASFPSAAAPANGVSMAEVLRDIWDAVRNGTGGTEPATNKSVIDAIGFNGSAFVAGGLAKYLPQCVAKTDGAVLNGNDDIFTVVGTVRCKIVGLVTTVLGGAANGRLKMTTTVPSATIDLNAGAVAIDTDAAGTLYYNLGATSVFTPSSTLGFALLDPVTVEETEFLLTDGTVHFNSSAAQSGVIAWYMTYTPLTPGASVTAAA